MKAIIFFLAISLLACSCQKNEEEMIDLDDMAYTEAEMTTEHLAGDPLESPQETLLKESAFDLQN